MANPTGQPVKLKERIASLFKKNRFEKELGEYLDLARDHPGDTRVLIKIAETYFKAKQVVKAIETYHQVAAQYEKENFFLKAVAVYKNILMLKPDLIEVNLKLAELYAKIGMGPDTVNQYRIAMQHFENVGDKDKMVETARKLVEVDGSSANRRRLAEIYQNVGMQNEAMEQYDVLSREFRLNKQYDDLLRIYELILPHKPKSLPLIRDICILYLRRQEPEHAIKIMERYHVDAEPDFTPLYEKAKLMKDAMKKQR